MSKAIVPPARIATGIDRRRLLGLGAASVAALSAARSVPALAQAVDAVPDPATAAAARDRQAVQAIAAAARPLPPIDADGFASFIDDYADAKVILLGESTHGTDEFYRARAAITERLVREHGFSAIAVEADWPDAARIDSYIRGHTQLPSATSPFQRFPTWMWRNTAVRDFVDRLKALNDQTGRLEDKVGFYGLDLYSLPSSMDAVVDILRRHEPSALDEVRQRYGCLAPWVDDPAEYGALAIRDRIDTCTDEVAAVVEKLVNERMTFLENGDLAYFHALQNARVVAASEAYYRAMYEGSAESWNLRDRHMFQTLKAIFEARGPDTKAVIWAHNSHVGNAAFTGMSQRGEINIGQLCKEEWGDDAVTIGLGTDHGTVTAASDWDGATQTMRVRPSLPGSWGALMREAGPDRFFLPIHGAGEPLAGVLRNWRPERFIGVIYRPETEIVSHYVGAGLGRQFDGWLWFEQTTAVMPLPAAEIELMPATYPFAL